MSTLDQKLDRMGQKMAGRKRCQEVTYHQHTQDILKRAGKLNEWWQHNNGPTFRGKLQNPDTLPRYGRSGSLTEFLTRHHGSAEAQYCFAFADFMTDRGRDIPSDLIEPWMRSVYVRIQKARA